MMKRISAVMVALFMVVCTSIPTFAEANYKINDRAELFTSDEYTELEEILYNVSDATGWDVVVYTNERNISKYDMEDFCNDYYDSAGLGRGDEYSGVLLTVDMGSREMYVLTKGEAMAYFTDSRVDEILDDVVYYLSDDEYVEAVKTFAEDVEYFYDSGISEDGGYDNVYISPEDENINPLLKVLRDYGIIIGIVAVVAAVLSVVFVSLRYKNHGKSNTYDLQGNSVTNLTMSNDVFLHKSVSVTTISSSSSGGSSGGRSGGGSSSHGGGGRSF